MVRSQLIFRVSVFISVITFAVLCIYNMVSFSFSAFVKFIFLHIVGPVLLMVLLN